MKATPHSTACEPNWPETIVNNLIDAVVVMDQESIVRYINPAADRLAGHTPLAAPGNPASRAFAFLDRKERKPLELPTTNIFETPPPDNTHSVVLTQVVFAPPAQRELIVNAIFTPITQEDGSVTGVILRFRDVTQDTHQDRKERDKQKIQTIGTMASSVAREFANWLGLISGHAAAIADNLIPRTRAYEEAINILDATRRATGLTKRLLSIARTSNEADAISPRHVHLDAVIRNAVNQAQTVFGSSGITFKIKIGLNMPLVLADSDQLLDCFMNLFRNAFDAMPNGGTITIDLPASRGPFPNRKYVIIRIRDTGQGIEKHVLEHAFTPFYSTKDPTAAIGLGLTVVQTSVEQWDGMVKIRSRPGHGTSVRLFLRAAHVHDAETGKEMPTPPSAEILIVDDKDAFLSDLSVVLESAGYRTHKTSSADDCLSFYQRHSDEIDLVIIDVVMPGRDGKNVLDSILTLDPQATVIMTSGFSRDYIRNYLKRGTWGFVQKPVDPEYLLSTVQRMLQEE